VTTDTDVDDDVSSDVLLAVLKEANVDVPVTVLDVEVEVEFASNQWDSGDGSTASVGLYLLGENLVCSVTRGHNTRFNVPSMLSADTVGMSDVSA
jgi:hypothetical protein